MTTLHAVLPIPVRRKGTAISIPPTVLQVEAPVERAVRTTCTSIDPNGVLNDDELELNALIYEAQLNAESNRMTRAERACTEPVILDIKTVPPKERMRSITFGSESELVFIRDEVARRTLCETIRMSKDFDGNRSGQSTTKN